MGAWWRRKRTARGTAPHRHDGCTASSDIHCVAAQLHHSTRLFRLRLRIGPRRSGLVALWNDYRVERELFHTFAPRGNARTQTVELCLPLRWDARTRSHIGAARFVTLEAGAGNGAVGSVALRRVMGVLISGRPVVGSGGSTGSLPGPLAALDVDGLAQLDLYRATDHTLHRLALVQLRALVTGLLGDRSREPVVTVLLPTRRPELVAAAVGRVQAQQGVRVRLLVGCHGFDPSTVDEPGLVNGAVETAEVVAFDASVVFGDMLAALSQKVDTPLVAKWDDDDLYGVHHLFDLWLFANLSGRALVGKGATFVLLEGSHTLVRRHLGGLNRPTAYLAGGTLMVSRDVLMALGNWAPLPHSVDQDLIARFKKAGCETLQVHGYDYVLVRHGDGHTWNPGDSYFTSHAVDLWDAGRLTQTGVITVGPATPHAGGADVHLGLTAAAAARSVAVCVPNHNNHDALRLCDLGARHLLAELNDRAGDGHGVPAVPEVEFVVCDDRSDPPLQTPSAGSPLRIVRLDTGEGFGLSRARNAAVHHSTGDVIVMMDDDIYVEPDVLARITDLFGNGFRGIVHADITFVDMTIGEFTRRAAYNHRNLKATLKQRVITGQDWRYPHWAQSSDLTHPRSTSFRATIGGFIACDRTTFMRAGGFRDMAAYGGEDTEFGYRAQLAGAEQQVWRHGGIWHIGQRTIARGISPELERDRQQRMRSLIPIWDATLTERSDQLHGWTGPTTTFAELCPPPGHVTTLAPDPLWARFTQPRDPGTKPAENVIDAPFAIGHLSDPNRLNEALEAANRKFRTSRCGEVVVTDRDGNPVMHLWALWAVNLAANRLGDTTLTTTMPKGGLPDAVTTGIRTDAGWASVTLA